MEFVSPRVLGTYYLGESSDSQPRHFLAIAECIELARQGKGAFINRKKAFRRWDILPPQEDNQTYRSSGRRGESLMINEPMMIRYVEGEPYAIQAVNAWL